MAPGKPGVTALWFFVLAVVAMHPRGARGFATTAAAAAGKRSVATRGGAPTGAAATSTPGATPRVDNAEDLPAEGTTRTSSEGRGRTNEKAPTGTNNTNKNNGVADDGSRNGGGEEEQRQQRILLRCPSSFPSKTFRAPNVEATRQQITRTTEDGSGGVAGSFTEFLPLQKYHARATTTRQRVARRNRRRTTRSGDDPGGGGGGGASPSLLVGGPSVPVTHDIPSLEFIHQNLSRYRITKSSQVLLQEYIDHKATRCGIERPGEQPHETDHQQQQQPQQQPHKDSETGSSSNSNKLEQLRGRLRSKIRAECRASLPLAVHETLKIIYCDSHICVANKPSGVLSVPGHRRNPSLAGLVYDTIEPSSTSTPVSSIPATPTTASKGYYYYDDDGSIDNVDQSVVHRLDMATSGIIVYALSKAALSELHVTFRDRDVEKTYQALVEGHLPASSIGTEAEIDVALERDPTNPPYMRIAQPRDNNAEASNDDVEEEENTGAGSDDGTNDTSNGHGGTGKKQRQKQGGQPPHKLFREAPKPSKTTWSVLGYEHDRDGNPLTRVALKPHTGRTHQLRVHTSRVLDAPIVGDDIYGSGFYSGGSDHESTPLCLHAQKLCIRHPISGASMVFEADPPF